MILQDSTSHILHGTAAHKTFLLNPHMVASLWTTTFLMLKTKTNKNFTFFSEETQNSRTPFKCMPQNRILFIFFRTSVYFSQKPKETDMTPKAHTLNKYTITKCYLLLQDCKI